jgi:hypothetical protein
MPLIDVDEKLFVIGELTECAQQICAAGLHLHQWHSTIASTGYLMASCQ